MFNAVKNIGTQNVYVNNIKMYLKERVYEKVGRYISLRIETAGF
jgi:hypothetical protein